MSEPQYPLEPSPDPFERFPLYAPQPTGPEPGATRPVPAPDAAPPVNPPALVVQPSYAPVPLTDQQQPSETVVVVSWVLTILSGLYLLPWAVAASRGKANRKSVFWVNLLTGWTAVGWIIALVMACTAHHPLYPVSAPLAIGTGPAPGWYPDPDGTGTRYWDGHAWGARMLG